MDRIRGKDNRLLVAVTGGIASGKSVVSGMLEEMGAPLIDLDDLAREVVEPGREAWKEIVEFFGREILQKDNRIDRKKLSDVVFRDPEKRKQLERFTHPRILEEMRGRADKIASGNPDAIIQFGFPLLFELNLQGWFHKVLLVYTRREIQIRRLMERESIGSEAAEKILAAQLPIDEKLAYADYVIYNEGSLSETKGQVEKVWRQLKEEQRKRGQRSEIEAGNRARKG